MVVVLHIGNIGEAGKGWIMVVISIRSIVARKSWFNFKKRQVCGGRSLVHGGEGELWFWFWRSAIAKAGLDFGEKLYCKGNPGFWRLQCKGNPGSTATGFQLHCSGNWQLATEFQFSGRRTPPILLLSTQFSFSTSNPDHLSPIYIYGNRLFLSYIWPQFQHCC